MNNKIFKINFGNSTFLLFTFFFILNIWHPFSLGFFADDWNYITHYKFLAQLPENPFNYNIFNYFLQCFGNRPVVSLTFYLGYSICGGTNFVLWQFWTLILWLLSIFTFRLVSKEFFKILGYCKNSFLQEFATVIFGLSPWMMAYNHWISLSMNLPFLIFFNLAIYYFLKSYQNHETYFFRSAFFLLLSYLSYEAFYFQWFLFLIFVFKYKGFRKVYHKNILIPFVLFSFVQIVVILWNRISIPFFKYIVIKSLDPYTLQLFVANLLSLPYVWIASFVIGSIILIPLLIFIIVKIFKYNKANHLARNEIMLLSTIFVLGLLLSLALFAVAGYSIWGLGMRSRTMIVFAWYLSLYIGYLVLFVDYHKVIFSKTIYAIVIIIIVDLTFSNIQNSLDWRTTWEIEKEVIAKIPTRKILSTDKNAIILVNLPYKYHWISLFDYQWSINAQMNYGKSVIFKSNYDTTFFRFFFVGNNIIHPIKNVPVVNYWNGKELFQFYDMPKKNKEDDLKGYFYTREFKMSGSELWVWNYPENTFTKITNNEKFEFEKIKNYDYWITYLYNKFKGLEH